MARHAHYTKSGPGRHHEQGDGKRPHPLGFADTYMAAKAAERRESRQFRQQYRRDAHDMASTMVGRLTVFDLDIADDNGLPRPLTERRVWLGGISAQRGW